MTTYPLETLDPAESVQVLPRHLAGPGTVDPRAVWGFPFAEGWPFAQTEEGAAVAFSPCLLLQTTYDPKAIGPSVGPRGAIKPSKGVWTVTARWRPFVPPTWKVAFDATTPAEAVHDFHRELLALYREHPNGTWLFQPRVADSQVYAPLLARGWHHAVQTDGIQIFRPPDGTGGLSHQYTGKHVSTAREPVTAWGPWGGFSDDQTAAWRAWGGIADDPEWRARFTVKTPARLVGAFTSSLASAEPLQRTVESLQRTVKSLPVQGRRSVRIVTPAGKQLSPGNQVAAPPARVSGRTR
ncbi:DUF317 domain-containing protein [Streptomyces albidoflavus]|uniref:DUF317 domain-containing protein n=1 Tax=Streptomyces albidoflavus TaxID=1886 RepID=UPI00101E7673|nr:DUF317 domain-containing protein [Streptomyces albidoflavus]RZD82206.1 hypothetical protein C0Q63_22450 [Streptomyces albidoflavus]